MFFIQFGMKLFGPGLIMAPPCVHRYASLYFCLAVENQENELLGLEVIHRYVELLDKYFGNVILYRVTSC